MNLEMFREYDIRGIYPDAINEESSYTIGKAFASYVKNKNIIIGHDNRISSVSIHDSLLKGLLECGANVLDLGLCTTPMYYAMKKHLKYESGIMITASHNPKEYNGFKISFDIIGNAVGKQITDFRDFCLKGDFTYSEGTYQKYDETENYYLNLIKNGITMGNKKLKVVFDPANGTSSIIIHKVLKMFDFEYTIINGISDGNFPNHHPDPCEPKNMEMLADYVKKHNYDLGIGIDGDADRVGFVDNKGNFVPIDKIMILIYKYMNKKMRNRKAVMDVKCSKALIDEMKSIDMPIEVARTGAAYANIKINTEDYDFGGEFSGHLFFKDRFPGFDDGIYAGLRVIEILSNIKDDLFTLLERQPKYRSTPEIKIPMPDNKKTKVIVALKKYLDEKNIKYNNVDGVRIDYEDGFTLVRQSNTTPNLTVRFERKKLPALEKEQKEFLALIEKISSEII